jgi:hypothetical protein
MPCGHKSSWLALAMAPTLSSSSRKISSTLRERLRVLDLRSLLFQFLGIGNHLMRADVENAKKVWSKEITFALLR